MPVAGQQVAKVGMHAAAQHRSPDKLGLHAYVSEVGWQEQSEEAARTQQHAGESGSSEARRAGASAARAR